jgi:hypothetical protein
MRLGASASYGSMAAFSFQKRRIVVLNRNGSIVAVFGDGEASLEVA